MRVAVLAALIALSAPHASAGVTEAIDDSILPGTAAFAAAAAALDAAARSDCRAEALRPAYQSAFDAWMGVSHLRFGPMEEEGRGLAIAFWPDKRGMAESTVARLIADQDAAVDDPAAFAQVSVAGRGLFALERLLYEPDRDGYGADGYECRLARAISSDLARVSGEIDREWREAFAAELRDAGESGSGRFLTEKEAAQALFTALDAGLEFDAEQRLGRPLGTFDRPWPQRAEARRSGRSLRNVVLSLEALRGFARALATGPIPRSEDAFADALADAEALDDPVFAGVADPSQRLKAEILRQKIDRIRREVRHEIGAPLGVAAGFNSQDGD
jgi:uncharacterized protein